MKTLANILATATLLAWASIGFAQDEETGDGTGGGGDSLELTIMLMPENAVTPDAVTRVIELPARAAAEAAENAGNGLERANSARENRGGNDIAEQARQGGRDFGQSMRELAQENRENNGRGEPPENPGRPDMPGRPDDAGPPADLPGPPQNP